MNGIDARYRQRLLSDEPLVFPNFLSSTLGDYRKGYSRVRARCLDLPAQTFQSPLSTLVDSNTHSQFASATLSAPFGDEIYRVLRDSMIGVFLWV